MSKLSLGTQAARNVSTSISSSISRASNILEWDQEQLLPMFSSFLSGSSDSPLSLIRTTWVAGEMAKTLQTLSYLRRAARNLT